MNSPLSLLHSAAAAASGLF
jgi:hypothetical protein